MLKYKGPSMRPELELLLCCARSTVSSESASQIRSLVQQNIDWSYVIDSASRHGVIPLLYLNLRDVCADAVPKTMLNSLRDRFHANARSNLCLSAELLKILDLFESNGVLALAYKGPLLATSVYGNLALRPAGDLDILIDKKNLQRAKELLESNGYTIQLSSARQRYYLKNRSHYHFEHEDRQT